MAEKVMIDLSGLADFTPYEGMGSNDLLTHDGLFKVKLMKITSGKAKQTQNPILTVQAVVLDEDNKGKNLVTTVVVGGVDSRGEKLVRKLGELLASVGTSIEKIRALAGNGSIDADELIASLTNKEAHVSAEAEQYEGRTSSKVQNWVLPKAYNDAVAAGAHRKPHRILQPFAAPAGASATGGQTVANLGGPGTAPAAGGTNGAPTDARSKLASLNLGL